MKIDTEKTIHGSAKGANSIQSNIPETSLFAYEQAANEFDISLRIAEKGEPFGISDSGTALIAKEGNVGINYMTKKPINSDGSKYDYSSFGARVKELIAQAQEQENGEHLPKPYEFLSVSDNSVKLIIPSFWETYYFQASELTDSDITTIDNEKYEIITGTKVPSDMMVVDIVNRFEPLDLATIFNMVKQLEALDVRK